MKNNLVIGVSQSGKAADVMEVLKAANSQGALTVSITNDEQSPMAKLAQYHIFLAAGEEKSVAATKTMIGQMYILACLAAEMSGDSKYYDELKNLPNELAKIFELESAIDKVAIRYKDAKDCYVLARGTNYAVAQEAALKIQETTYVRAKAYAASDFHHGPFAVVDEHTRAILFVPTGESKKDMIEMAEKIKVTHADVTLVTDDIALAKNYQASIIIPRANDFISPFYNVIVAQLFALRLALARGMNPDSPRGLNKVTITK